MNRTETIDEIQIESDTKVTGYIEKGKNYSWSDLMDIIDDMAYEIDNLKDEIENMKQDIEDNYRPIPLSEQNGISDRDFI